MADRSEELFQSIETIAKGLVSDLKFNKTVICTIKDNKDAKNGRYYVTDGTSNFYAFSENTDYLNNQSVYVLIPNDDYSNQKIITGRYLADEENNSYIYKVPWNSFVNITNNLYDNANNIDAQDHSSLIANGLVKEINLWSNENLNLKGYTTIGIRANFKTLLADLNTVSGHYGIRIKIRFVNDTTSQKKASSIIRQIEFNNDDMYGNTYNFETFYTQSKLFTISEPDKIIDKVWVTFFQDGDFKTAYGLNTPIASTDNIFVKNVYLAFGYDLNSFDSDQVLLYTLNSSTYDATSTVEENKKILNLRWVHKLEDNSLQYYAEENEEYSSQMIIHWYKYNLATGVQDNLAGNFWEEIQDAQNKFQYIIQPDVMQAEEKYKIIIESPVVNEVLKNINDYELNTAKSNLEEKLQIYNDYKNNYETSSDLEIQNNLKLYENEYEEALNEYQFLVSKYSIETQYYESNILSLTNESIVADYASIDLINGLQIECDLDGYNGIYNIYNLTNEIVNNSESSKLRVLTAVFNSIITGQESLDTAEKITWKIPLTQTMIQKPVDGKEYNISQEDEYFESNDGTYCLITRDGTKATGNIGSSFLNATNQYFRIKPYLIENATNNIITCYVTKNNITYSASVSLTFGTSGTSGTDYTFILSWEDGINCIYHKDAYINAGIADESDKPIKIDAHLYDERNNEILLNNVEFSWVNSLIDSDFENNTNISFCDENGNSLLDDNNEILDKINGPGYCYIHFDEKTSNFENYSILKAEVTTDTEDVKSNGESLGYKVILTAYLSIPLCYDLSITNIEGCTKILYNSLGAKPQYYTGAYRIFSNDIELESQWSVNIKDSKNIDNNNLLLENYYLSVKENENYYYPVVPSMYFAKDGICCVIGKTVYNDNIVWIQPIIIQQDTYSSAMLNSWNGELTIDEQENRIMATMLGAGSKDSYNRFSGVLIGDITSDDQGIFGYHEGAQSFGFRTNGKAFIGKANKGRIEFDGNSGSIKSMSYKTGSDSTGMLIDLDDGFIDIQGATKNNVENTSEITPTYIGTNSQVKISALSPYMSIKENNVTIFKISTEESFIQTNNYNKNSQIGAKITLKGADDSPDGTQENPSFDLRAFSTSGGIRISSISPFIQVKVKKNEQESVTIFQIDNKKSFIQTVDYDNGAKTGAQIVLNDSTDSTTKPSFKIKGYSSDGTGGIELSSTNPYFVVQAKQDGAIDFTKLIVIGDRNYYLQSIDYSSTNTTGTNINLSNGKITSYSFDLKAINNNIGTIFISSTNNTYPFRIEGEQSSSYTSTTSGNHGKISVGDLGNSFFRIKWNGDFEAGNSHNNLKYQQGHFTIKGGSIDGSEIYGSYISGGELEIGSGNNGEESFFYVDKNSVDIGDWHVSYQSGSGGRQSFYYGSWDSSMVGISGNPPSGRWYLWAGYGQNELPEGASAILTANSGGVAAANLTTYGVTSINNLTTYGVTSINNIAGTSHYENTPLGTILETIYSSIKDENGWNSWLIRNVPSLPDHATFCPRR